MGLIVSAKPHSRLSLRRRIPPRPRIPQPEAHVGVNRRGALAADSAVIVFAVAADGVDHQAVRQATYLYGSGAERINRDLDEKLGDERHERLRPAAVL